MFALDFWAEGSRLDDEAHLSDLQFRGRLQITAARRSVPINRLYFQDLEDARLVIDVDGSSDPTFASIVPLLPPVSGGSLIFEQNNKLFPFHQKVMEYPGDPTNPITICLAALSIKVCCQEGDDVLGSSRWM
jgi:hypothetical protein